jgi:hypothetical protein
VPMLLSSCETGGSEHTAAVKVAKLSVHGDVQKLRQEDLPHLQDKIEGPELKLDELDKDFRCSEMRSRGEF